MLLPKWKQNQPLHQCWYTAILIWRLNHLPIWYVFGQTSMLVWSNNLVSNILPSSYQRCGYPYFGLLNYNKLYSHFMALGIKPTCLILNLTKSCWIHFSRHGFLDPSPSSTWVHLKTETFPPKKKHGCSWCSSQKWQFKRLKEICPHFFQFHHFPMVFPMVFPPPLGFSFPPFHRARPLWHGAVAPTFDVAPRDVCKPESAMEWWITIEKPHKIGMFPWFNYPHKSHNTKIHFFWR